MTELKIYYPTGLISVVSYSPLRADIVQPLKSPGLLTNGSFGANLIQDLGLTDKGTIETRIVLGAPGSIRSIAFLVDKWPNPTRYVGIALDDINRPFAYLSIDGFGTVLGQSLPTGPANPQGDQLKIRLSYNLRSPVHGDRTAFLQIEEIGQEFWAVEPGLAPGLLQPQFLVVGSQVSPDYLDFNGSINWAQVCGNVEVIPETVEEQEETSPDGVLDQSLDFPL